MQPRSDPRRDMARATPRAQTRRVIDGLPVPGDVETDQRLIDAVEELVVAAIGMTAAALAHLPDSQELTVTQWRVLVVVARTDGTRVRDIAARVGASGPSTSRLVRRLEDRGLVVTTRDETDRRGTIVRTTASGRALWQAVTDERRRIIRRSLVASSRPVSASVLRQLHELARALDQHA